MIVNHQEIYELTLVATEQCNLKCKYCFVDKSHGQTMNLATAIREIDRMMKSAKKFDGYLVSFMGGEPFLVFNLIKEIVEYTEHAYPEKKCRFNIVTNGTLTNPEIKDWIRKNNHMVHVTLSIDGRSMTHNRNRCGSFSDIDVPFFASLSEATANMVVSPSGLLEMVDNISFLEGLGFKVKVFLEEGISWQISDMEILSIQLQKLIEYYIDHPASHICSLLRNSIYFILSDDLPLGCGHHVFTYSISADGKRYDCHRCMPYENNGVLKIKEEYIKSLDKVGVLDVRCHTCPINFLCNACPASNASRKDSRQLSEIYCLQRKILYKAQAYMIARLTTECPDHLYFREMSSKMLTETLKAAEIILKTIDCNKPF